MLRSAALLVGLCLVVACRPIAQSPRDATVDVPLIEEKEREGFAARRVGEMFSIDGDTLALLTAPTTAQRGDSIEIGLTTTGGGCSREDTTVVNVKGLQATIVPYQRVLTPVRPHGYCAETLRLSPLRTVRVVFDTVGDARLSVLYRNTQGGPLRVFERRIMIR